MKKIIKWVLSIVSALICGCGFIELIFKNPLLVMNVNIWQLFAISLICILLVNIEKIKELALKIGDSTEVSIKFNEQDSKSAIEYNQNQNQNKKEILFYYSKNIPVKIWDNDSIKREAVNDLKTLLSKDLPANEKIINSIDNLCILLENFKIRKLKDYGTNSNGTYIIFNEDEVACVSKFHISSMEEQNILVSFPAQFSNLPAVNIINRPSYMNIFNVSKNGFIVQVESKKIDEKDIFYIAHG